MKMNCRAVAARSGERTPVGRGRAGAAAGGSAAAVVVLRTWAVAAMRTFSVSTRTASFNAIPSVRRGLWTKSTAPSSSARSAASDPSDVRLDSISTGIGRSRIRRSRKSSPSIFGIWMSRMSTSGSSVRIISLATNGSGAEPTTSMSSSLDSSRVSNCWISGESSTMRTEMRRLVWFVMIRWPRLAGLPGAPLDRARQPPTPLRAMRQARRRCFSDV